MLVISLIITGILLRFAPHAPNFTPVAAIALFGGAYLNRKYALIVPLALMAVSDMFIGMHDAVIFTWGSFAVISMLGLLLKNRKNPAAIAGMSVLASVIFYAISNLGVWIVGWYPRTLKGLVDCYIMGLPFLRDFTVATLVYSAGFFGVYEAVAHLVKGKKLAKVLLTK
jgi:hypothetical protein